MALENPTVVFNRKYIFKWSIFHCFVSLTERRLWWTCWSNLIKEDDFLPKLPDKLTDKHVPLARDSKLHMIKSMSIQVACGSAADVRTYESWKEWLNYWLNWMTDWPTDWLTERMNEWIQEQKTELRKEHHSSFTHRTETNREQIKKRINKLWINSQKTLVSKMYTIPVFTIADLPAKRRHFWVDWSSELP